MAKQKIIAQFDGSYSIYKDDMYRVGAGYSINGETFREQYIAGTMEHMGSVFAEVLALMGLLEKLQGHKKCHITIKGDNLPVISLIRKKNRAIRGLEVQFDYLRLLIEELRLAGNSIVFEWVPREQNKDCDAAASHKERFIFCYQENEKVKQMQIYDYFYEFAKEAFDHWIKSHSNYQVVEQTI